MEKRALSPQRPKVPETMDVLYALLSVLPVPAASENQPVRNVGVVQQRVSMDNLLLSDWDDLGYEADRQGVVYKMHSLGLDTSLLENMQVFLLHPRLRSGIFTYTQPTGLRYHWRIHYYD